MIPRVVRISGVGSIEVRLDPSLLVLAAAVIWVFTRWFREDHAFGIALAMAVIGAVLVVATTFAHELGHALEARHRGIEVVAITLLLFGGVTEMHAQGQTARDELAVAAVGPYVSLVSGAIFGIIATLADAVLPAAAAGPVGEVAGVLGWWNVLLAVFNLVPGAPLDGGRVLRALLWMAFGDRMRALVVTVRLGQGLGLALVGFGLWTLWVGGATAWFSVLVFVVLGGFLLRAASSELAHARMDAAMEGRTVAELMGPRAEPLAPTRRLDTLARPDGSGADAGTDRGDLIAVVDAGLLVGVIEAASLHAGPDGWLDGRTAGDLAEPLGDVPSVDVDDDLHTLIDRFQGEHHVVRLVADGREVGALTEREVARALALLRRERGRSRPTPQPATETVA